jgi:hypothetical protein
VNAYCTGYGSCCASKGFAFNDAACSSLLGPQFTAQSICPAPGTYNAQAAQACFAELEASLSACTRDIKTDSPCLKMCNGTQPAGASCTSNIDCAGPVNGAAACRVNAGESTGVCVTTTVSNAGGPCNETCTEVPGGEACTPLAGASAPIEASVCRTNDGLYCAVDGICKTTLAVGTVCTQSDVCVTGAHCNLSTFVCVSNADVGAPCPAGNECASGAYCSPQHVCAAKKAAGEACQGSLECQGVCDATSVCSTPVSTTLDVTAESCASAPAS